MNAGGFIVYVCLKTSWIDEDAAPPSCSTTFLPRTAENPALKSPNLDIFTEEDRLGVIRIFPFGKLQVVGTIWCRHHLPYLVTTRTVT